MKQLNAETFFTTISKDKDSPQEQFCLNKIAPVVLLATPRCRPNKIIKSNVNQGREILGGELCQHMEIKN